MPGLTSKEPVGGRRGVFRWWRPGRPGRLEELEQCRARLDQEVDQHRIFVGSEEEGNLALEKNAGRVAEERLDGHGELVEPHPVKRADRELRGTLGHLGGELPYPR